MSAACRSSACGILRSGVLRCSVVNRSWIAVSWLSLTRKKIQVTTSPPRTSLREETVVPRGRRASAARRISQRLEFK